VKMEGNTKVELSCEGVKRSEMAGTNIQLM
jgi:hypothetical protein